MNTKAQVIRRRVVKQLPLGTVRVRMEGGEPSWREIKVGMTGPIQRRWMAYARWWWLQNKGPIPEGMRVLHLDGDSMNDDPENLLLGTAADNVFLAHERDPAMSEANYHSRRRATAEHNRLRSRIRRAAGWLDSKWYPVDLTARVVHNRPVKRRYQVWAAVGFDAGKVQRNGEGCEAAALGFPGVPVLEAVIMDVMLRAGRELDGVQLRERARARYADFGMAFPKTMGPVYVAMLALRRRGWITTRRMGRNPGVSMLMRAGVEARGTGSPVVPVRGSVLRRDVRYADFRREDAEVGVRPRVSAFQGLEALARAIAGGVGGAA